MRFAIAQPCLGSSETVLRIKRSSVPWTRSFGLAIPWLSTIGLVDCQGMASANSTPGKSGNRKHRYWTRRQNQLRRLPRLPDGTWETEPLAGVYTRWSGFTESVWPSTSCGSLGLLTSQNTIPRASAAPAKAAMTLGVVW